MTRLATGSLRGASRSRHGTALRGAVDPRAESYYF